MTDIKPEWVEAGARASALWHRGEDTFDSDDLALTDLVIAAVAPLIRADERPLLEYAGKRIAALCEERDATRAEVAALREQVANGEAIARGMVAQARREVLADLRAKVEGLPQHEHTTTTALPGGMWVQYRAAGINRKAVLALIEEAQP